MRLFRSYLLYDFIFRLTLVNLPPSFGELRFQTSKHRRHLLLNGADTEEDQPQCSLFETDDSPPSPPAVFIGGFGGSSSRLVATLFQAAGVYMTTRDPNSDDSLALRQAHCAMNNPNEIVDRLKRRSARNDLTETLLGAPKREDAWSAKERSQLSCLVTLFDDDIARGTNKANGCVWGFKEPRLMYYANLVHFGLGAKKYVHVVRDLRSMHHLHIEHDPNLLVSALGGLQPFADAVDAAFFRMAAADLPSLQLMQCKGNRSNSDHSSASTSHQAFGGGGGARDGGHSCGYALALDAMDKGKNGGMNCAKSKNVNCKRITDKLSHRVAFAVGWSVMHSSLSRACRRFPPPTPPPPHSHAESSPPPPVVTTTSTEIKFPTPARTIERTETIIALSSVSASSSSSSPTIVEDEKIELVLRARQRNRNRRRRILDSPSDKDRVGDEEADGIDAGSDDAHSSHLDIGTGPLAGVRWGNLATGGAAANWFEKNVQEQDEQEQELDPPAIELIKLTSPSSSSSAPTHATAATATVKKKSDEKKEADGSKKREEAEEEEAAKHIEQQGRGQPYVQQERKAQFAWIHLLRVETLWDRATCKDAFQSLIRELDLGHSSSSSSGGGVDWQTLCNGNDDTRTRGYVYSQPDPMQPFVPEHPLLTMAGVTAMALPGLRAMGYVLGEGANEREAFLSDVFGDEEEDNEDDKLGDVLGEGGMGKRATRGGEAGGDQLSRGDVREGMGSSRRKSYRRRLRPRESRKHKKKVKNDFIKSKKSSTVQYVSRRLSSPAQPYLRSSLGSEDSSNYSSALSNQSPTELRCSGVGLRRATRREAKASAARAREAAGEAAAGAAGVAAALAARGGVEDPAVAAAVAAQAAHLAQRVASRANNRDRVSHLISSSSTALLSNFGHHLFGERSGRIGTGNSSSSTVVSSKNTSREGDSESNTNHSRSSNPDIAGNGEDPVLSSIAARGARLLAVASLLFALRELLFRGNDSTSITAAASRRKRNSETPNSSSSSSARDGRSGEGGVGRMVGFIGKRARLYFGLIGQGVVYCVGGLMKVIQRVFCAVAAVINQSLAHFNSFDFDSMRPDAPLARPTQTNFS